MAIRPTPRPYECEACGQTHKRCLAHNKSGGPCGRIPEDGADVCLNHGGGAPQVKAAARERVQLELARRECDKLGIEVEIDPAEALIRAVWRAQGNLMFYEAQVARLDDVITGETGPGGAYKQTAHPLVILYHDAEKWVANVSSAALRAGVEERRVRMAERDSAQIIQAQVDTLIAMGLESRLDEFRVAFVASLDRVASANGPGGTGSAALAGDS